MPDASPSVHELNDALLDESFLATLGNLKAVGLDPEAARAVLNRRREQGIRTYVARFDGETVGTASLIVEQKFIHQGGLVGHIEDVSTRSGFERRGIGKMLVEHAVAEAWKLGCYKVILCSEEANQPFYERCGFRPHEREMRIDRP